ncbi:MAG: DUF2339 domain-containing protein, partial [Planctomycetales bacterium]|nr:DUF2339 domain-containing protein [Planctomycetales bacterium]
MWAAIIAIVGKVIFFDLQSWGLHDWVYGRDYSLRDATMRLLDFGVVIAFLAAAYSLSQIKGRLESARATVGAASLGMLFIYLTLEVNTFLAAYYPGLQAGGVSLVWAAFGLSLILSGIHVDAKPLRYVGLTLLALVSMKVFFIDLSSLDQFWRIIAFVGLGVLLIAGSFLYLRYREKFSLPAHPRRS